MVKNLNISKSVFVENVISWWKTTHEYQENWAAINSNDSTVGLYLAILSVFYAGSPSVGTYLVRRLPGAELLPEESTDQWDEDGHSVPLPDLARPRRSQVNQSPARLQEVISIITQKCPTNQLSFFYNPS